MARLLLAVCMVLALVSPAMAEEVTVIVASFANGLVTVEVDYDDANLRISRVRVINNSDAAAHVTATRISDGRSIAQRFPAQSSTFRSIPTSGPASERMEFFINPGGRLDGISFECLFPYP